MTKARDLANLISTGNPLADGALAASEVSGLHAVATSGAYANLTGKPTLATVATSGAYADVTGTPSLATVATSGAYSDLSGSPSGDSLLPSQSGNTGKFLTSNGSAASWADAGGGAYELITKTTISSSVTEVIFDNISAPQNQLLLILDAVKFDGQGNVSLQYRNSSGTNLDNTGGINANYPQAGTGTKASSGSTRLGKSGTQSYGIFLNNTQMGANTKMSGHLSFYNFGTTESLPYCNGHIAHRTSTTLSHFVYTNFSAEGVFSPSQTINGIRLYGYNSQNITSGAVYLYKLV